MENEINNQIETKEETVVIDEQKVIEKKKSTFRLFWLFVCIDIGLAIWVIYLIIKIFFDAFQAS